MLNKSLNELFVRWTYRIRRSSTTPNRLKHFIRPRLEEAEERLAPANLIAPVVANPTFIAQLTRFNPNPAESRPVDYSSPVVAVNPTRGLDVGAIAFVHDALRKARDAGAAIVLISTELDEALS